MMPALLPAILAAANGPAEHQASPFRARLMAKIIAGRVWMAARIYRGFRTNGNGFFRGVGIGIF
ncbi:hypothetical protein [Rhizobium sp. CCGE 510]|uniref:hypothetical protein n=1 Tax=Rhizobium sp. CCGE 510 TaxID=1132836 RepID=UPI00027B8452|nr:hypothetical protein [Rhizobium sp. CCGE 510]EJT02552.1 hypothetical protein RCCGE510_20499 [Rhizobium sp. CCGE 510]